MTGPGLARGALTQSPAWQALEAHHRQLHEVHLRTLFADDPQRGERLSMQAAGLYLDYSKNRLTDETLRQLVQLADERGLRARIDAMWSGERINTTEDRAVLHVALRAARDQQIEFDGRDVVVDVHAVLERMAGFCERVRSGAWTGYTGNRIRHIVNIGIGGSDLGPVMAHEALRHYSMSDLDMRFVSNAPTSSRRRATWMLRRRCSSSPRKRSRRRRRWPTRVQLVRGWSTRSATKRLLAGISSQYPRMRPKWRSSASTLRRCSASGTGWAAAIRWIRPSVCRR
jgi:hypothetical protein